jgi:GNAT superfamily N-acetyltransferase
MIAGTSGETGILGGQGSAGEWAATFTIRPASDSDARVVARHRAHMFRDMGELVNDAAVEALLQASRAELERALRDGTYVGWLAVDQRGDVIAGVGIHIKPQLPRPTPDGKGVAAGAVPLIVNVYTEPAWRKRGVARALMGDLLDWARARGVDRVVLHASKDGRRLYESLGFVGTNEMRWTP